MSNQPSTNEILQAVLKECCKENLKYKIVAIGCAGDVLKATKEDRFQEFSEIVIPLIKKVMTTQAWFILKKKKYSSVSCFHILLGLV